MADIVSETPKIERPEVSPAKKVTDFYFVTLCSSAVSNGGALWNFYKRLDKKPVSEFSQVMNTIRDETRGEDFCNFVISGFGKESGLDKETIEFAKSGQTTPMTYEVASILGKKLEGISQLSPNEQWAVADRGAREYELRMEEINKAKQG